MDERLKHTLSIVIDFVKFAEAKNAALLAADGVLIVGIIQAWSAQTHAVLWQCYYATYLLFFLSLSILVTLVSFMPLREFPAIRSESNPTPQDNLMFFGDIAKYDTNQYLRQVSDQSSTRAASSRYQKDLTGQIIINARVALRKYHCFTWALWLTIYGLTTPLTGVCLWLCLKHIKKQRPYG